MVPKKPADLTLPRGLMARMAHAVGTNLTKAQADGLISPDAVQRMQHHCDACGDPQSCRDLLSAHPENLPVPPGFCANRDLMLVIRNLAEQKKD